jgi:type II secretory pathway component PulM
MTPEEELKKLRETLTKVENILQNIEGDEDVVETATRTMKAFAQVIRERDQLRLQVKRLEKRQEPT